MDDRTIISYYQKEFVSKWDAGKRDWTIDDILALVCLVLYQIDNEVKQNSVLFPIKEFYLRIVAGENNLNKYAKEALYNLFLSKIRQQGVDKKRRILPEKGLLIERVDTFHNLVEIKTTPIDTIRNLNIQLPNQNWGKNTFEIEEVEHNQNIDLNQNNEGPQSIWFSLRERWYECDSMVWKMRITDSEYNQLKNELSTGRIYTNELALIYYAEWFRREYYDGIQQSKREIANSIGYQDFEDLYTKAIRVRNIGFYGILYLGGLPLNAISNTNNENFAWIKVLKKLAHNNIDFEDINRKNARESESLRLFCEQLISNQDDYTRMPFYCENEENIWYQKFRNIINKEREAAVRAPFLMDIEYIFDNVAENILQRYKIDVPNRLSSRWIDRYQLNNLPRIEFSLKNNNGEIIRNFVYRKRGESFNTRQYGTFRFECPLDSELNLIREDNNEIILTKKNILDTPKILYRTNDFFIGGNRIGDDGYENCIIFPENCILEENNNLGTHIYTIGNKPFNIVKIIDEHQFESLSYEQNGSQYFIERYKQEYCTGVQSNLNFHNDIKTKLYNCSNNTTQYYIYNDTDSRRVGNDRVEYRGRYQQEWSPQLQYGKIYARIKSRNNNFECCEMINIGDGFHYEVLESTAEMYNIRVSWDYGRIQPVTNCLNTNDEYSFTPDDCIDGFIRMQIIPQNTPNNYFYLEILPPFRELVISKYNHRLQNGECIARTNICSYNCIIGGLRDEDILQVFYGNIKINLEKSRSRLRRRIYEINQGGVYDLVSEDNISGHSSLEKFLGESDFIERELIKTNEDFLHASLDIEIRYNNEVFQFKVMDYPYRITKDPEEENSYIVKDGENEAPFTGILKVIPFESNQQSTYLIKDERRNIFHLPEIVMNQGALLIYGEPGNEILPRSVNNGTVLIHDVGKRIRFRYDSENIEDENSIWKECVNCFRLVSENNLPYSTFLQLRLLQEKEEWLRKFYDAVRIENLNIDVDKNLIQMADDLSFDWFWINGCEVRDLAEEIAVENFQGFNINDNTQDFFDRRYRQYNGSTIEGRRLQRVALVIDHQRDLINLFTQGTADSNWLRYRRSVLYYKNLNKDTFIQKYIEMIQN